MYKRTNNLPLFRRHCKFAVFFCVVVVVLFVEGVYCDNVAAAASTSDDGKTIKSNNKLIDLNEDNWQLMLKDEWMVEFYAPWCPACKSLAPTWERFANVVHDINVHVAKIDVTTYPSLSGRFFVTALPTIFHVKDGEFRQYRGSRDNDALMFFIKQKQWSKIEPLSAWKKPDTIHMSILHYFFKLSHLLKDFNTRLQEEYGLPTWGSYALFAISTIFVGAALGLLLVCIVDFLNPPKKEHRQSFSEAKERTLLNADVEDIANDELADDDLALDDDAEGDDDDDEDDDYEDENDDNEDDDDEANVNADDVETEDKHDDAENDDEDEDNDASTSEAEKLSMSESEAPESDKLVDKRDIEKKLKDALQLSTDDTTTNSTTTTPTTTTTTTTNTSSGDVRKRKPRKAD